MVRAAKLLQKGVLDPEFPAVIAHAECLSYLSILTEYVTPNTLS
jgi:hypothetical protein